MSSPPSMVYAQTVVQFLSVLTVLGQLIAVVMIVLLATNHPILGKISKHALALMFIVSLTAMLGSLFFSDVALWTPCRLCWYQRILMYPQTVLLAVALWRRDRGIVPYVLALSIIGAVIAALHYGEQVSAALYPDVIDPSIPCDTSGTSCASTPFFRFGYITIPMMALTAFILNILGGMSLLRVRK